VVRLLRLVMNDVDLRYCSHSCRIYDDEGAVTATFLPKGASLIIYFVEDGGIHRGRRDFSTPARLDWDIFNNMGYIRVHWLPLQTMNTRSDLSALVQLIDHELHLIGDTASSVSKTSA
jgi:hypothetical protein